MIGPAERAVLYRLFARMLTAEPDAELIATLKDSSVYPILLQSDPSLAAALCVAEVPAMRAEFARIFLLPRGVPPYASAWIEGDRERLAEQLAALTHRSMDALDMTQTRAVGHLSLDHLGLIFAVIAEALTTPRAAELGVHLEQQLLGSWVSGFAAALHRDTRSPLYRVLADLILAIAPSHPA